MASIKDHLHHAGHKSWKEAPLKSVPYSKIWLKHYYHYPHELREWIKHWSKLNNVRPWAFIGRIGKSLFPYEVLPIFASITLYQRELGSLGTVLNHLQWRTIFFFLIFPMFNRTFIWGRGTTFHLTRWLFSHINPSQKKLWFFLQKFCDLIGNWWLGESTREDGERIIRFPSFFLWIWNFWVIFASMMFMFFFFITLNPLLGLKVWCLRILMIFPVQIFLNIDNGNKILDCK